MTMRTAQDNLVAVIRWIDDRFMIEIPGDKRSRIAAGCLDVALEHQAAIAVLCSSELYGSLFSLLRILFESYVRGIWFFRCATERQLERFERDNFDVKFGDMIDQIEKQIGFPQSPLSSLKANSWKALNSFTHTGFMQVLRRNGEKTTGPCYPESEVVKALNVAGVLGLLTAIELANVAGDNELAEQVLAQACDFAAL